MELWGVFCALFCFVLFCFSFWKLPGVFVTLSMAVKGRLSKAMGPCFNRVKLTILGAQSRPMRVCPKQSCYPDFTNTACVTCVWLLKDFKKLDLISYLTSGCVSVWRDYKPVKVTVMDSCSDSRVNTWAVLPGRQKERESQEGRLWQTKCLFGWLDPASW